MKGYNQVFLRALEETVLKYQKKEIKFITEFDLQSHVFSECLKLMTSEKMEKPYKIHINKSIFSPRQKTDLVLGVNEVAVEFKFEPDYPGVSKPVAFREEVEKDIKRIEGYVLKGVQHAHFVMIDEDGFHKRNPRIQETWSELLVDDKRAYYLLISKEKHGEILS